MGGMTESEQAAAERRQGEAASVDDEGVRHHEAPASAEEVFVKVAVAGGYRLLTSEGGYRLLPSTSEAPTNSGVPADGTTNTPETSRAAKVSAAKALVAIRRRTGRAIPADVLQLAQQD